MKEIAVLVGCGVMGKRHRERILKRGAELVAELDSESAVDCFFKNQKACFENCRRAVFIASPSSTHFEYGKMALENGFDVFLEKPIAQRGGEVKELLDIAKKEKRVLFPGHSERYHGGFAYLKDVFENFKGREVSFFRHNLFSGRGQDVSVFLDLMVHDLEMLFALVKTDLYEISFVEKKSQDEALAKISFGSLEVCFSVNRNAKVSRREIVLDNGLDKELVLFSEHEKWDALDFEHEKFWNATCDSLNEEWESALRAVEVCEKLEVCLKV